MSRLKYQKFEDWTNTVVSADQDEEWNHIHEWALKPPGSMWSTGAFPLQMLPEERSNVRGYPTHTDHRAATSERCDSPHQHELQSTTPFWSGVSDQASSTQQEYSDCSHTGEPQWHLRQISHLKPWELKAFTELKSTYKGREMSPKNQRV